MDSERTRNLKELRQKRLQYFDKVSQPKSPSQSAPSANKSFHNKSQQAKPSSLKYSSTPSPNKPYHDNTQQIADHRSTALAHRRGHGSILAWENDERLAEPNQSRRSSGAQPRSTVVSKDAYRESYVSHQRRVLTQAQSKAKTFNSTRYQNGRQEDQTKGQDEFQYSFETFQPLEKGKVYSRRALEGSVGSQNNHDPHHHASAKSAQVTASQNGHRDHILPQTDKYQYSFENFKSVDKERFYSTKPVEDLTWNPSSETSVGRYLSADFHKQRRNPAQNLPDTTTLDSYDAFLANNMVQEMGHVQKLREKVHDEMKTNFDGNQNGWTPSYLGRRNVAKTSSVSDGVAKGIDENHNVPGDYTNGMRDKTKESLSSAHGSKVPDNLLDGVPSKRTQEVARKGTKLVEDSTEEDSGVDEFDLGALQEAAKQGDDVLRRYIKRLSQKRDGASDGDNHLLKSSEDEARYAKANRDEEVGGFLERHHPLNPDTEGHLKENGDSSNKIMSVDNGEEIVAHHDLEKRHQLAGNLHPHEDGGGDLNGDLTDEMKSVNNGSEDENHRDVEVEHQSSDDLNPHEEELEDNQGGDLTSDKGIDVRRREGDETDAAEEINESNPQEMVISGEHDTSQVTSTNDGAIKINGDYRPSITQPVITTSQLQELGLFEDLFSSSQSNKARSKGTKEGDQSDSSTDEDQILPHQDRCLEEDRKEDAEDGMGDLQLATHRPGDRPISPLKSVHAVKGAALNKPSPKWEFPYIHIPSTSVLKAELNSDANMSSDGSDAVAETDSKNLQPKPPGSLKSDKRNVHAAKHITRSSNNKRLSKPSIPKRPKTPERHIKGVRVHHEKERETRRPGSARLKRNESSSPVRSARINDKISDEAARVSVVNSSFQRGVSPERKSSKPVSVSSLDLRDVANDAQVNVAVKEYADISIDDDDAGDSEDEDFLIRDDSGDIDESAQLMQRIADFDPQAPSVVHDVGPGGDANLNPQVSFELPHQDAIDNLLGRSTDSKRKQSSHPAIRPSSAGPQRSNQSGAFPNRLRPSSAKSKIAQYVDGGPQVKRRWATSSSLWGSRSTSSAAGVDSIQIAGQRSSLANQPKSQLTRKSRPTSAKSVAALGSDGELEVRSRSQGQRSRPWSASASTRSKQNDYLRVGSAQLEEGQTVRVLDSYADRAMPPLTMRLIADSPRGSEGISLWQLLPHEILLHIFSYLTHYQLVTCAQTCSEFNRVALDESLWRHIQLKKRVLTDFWLTQIGERRPVHLEMVQCTGNITENGLRNLFRSCADNLKELNVSGCSSAELSGDSLLLHASRCYSLTSLDASWCNVSDNGLSAINDSVSQLKTLCLNGCREVSDTSLSSVIRKHGKSLKVLEVFGCFNLSVDTLGLIGEECKHLNTLNIGQCYKLTDDSIAKLAPHLKAVRHLDLRGCKQIRDGCIRKLVRHSKKLNTLVLAHCAHISNTALTEIATYLPAIKHLDLAGCKRVTNEGVRALATNCHQLTTLDISSTSIDHRSVASLASYCSKSLRGLKLNCCKDITESSVVKLLKHCRQLETLHLYGVKGLRTLGVLKLQYTCLMYEKK